MRFFIIIVVIFLSVVGCATSDIAYNKEQLGDATMLVTRGSARLVSERARSLPGYTNPPNVLCTEPSPDVAIALARSGSLNGSGAVPGGPTVSAGGTFSSSETASLQPGRTAGVVALRDGLYFACQAYVNGFIGQDSYALILSQYGKLLVQLTGATSADKTGGSTTVSSGGASPAAPASGLVLTVAGGSINTPVAAKAAPAAETPPTTPAASFTPEEELLVVACIAEFDPTRITPIDPSNKAIENKLLADNCPTFMAKVFVQAIPADAPAGGVAKHK